MIRVACDVHEWMEAWVLLLENPYFAITDENGSFSITDVPPGEYDVIIWHEALGKSTKRISIQAGGRSEVDFVIGG